MDSSCQRFMLRFHFQRTVEPSTPSWNHNGDQQWKLGVPRGLPDLRPVWLAAWRWMLGAMSQPLSDEMAVKRSQRTDAGAVLSSITRHLTLEIPTTSAVEAAFSQEWAKGEPLPAVVLESLSWCDWAAIRSEVWCCHVNWECCGHWRASPFGIAQRKLHNAASTRTALLQSKQLDYEGVVPEHDPRRSIVRQVPALCYAYRLATQGRLDILCEALLTQESTAIPVAQAMASAPRWTCPAEAESSTLDNADTKNGTDDLGQSMFCQVVKRLIEHLEESMDDEDNAANARCSEDCAFVLGEMSLQLQPHSEHDHQLLVRAVGVLCRVTQKVEVDPEYRSQHYLVRRSAVEALRHCCTALIGEDARQEYHQASLAAALQAIRTLLRAALHEADGSAAVLGALALLSLSRVAITTETACALQVRQALQLELLAAAQSSVSAPSNSTLGKGPKSYSQIVELELARDRLLSVIQDARLRPRPPLALHFLEEASSILAQQQATTRSAMIPFATKF